jgi:phytoene synthase
MTTSLLASKNVGRPSADAMLAAKGRSFYWARHLLGSVHAARATRLYGFCRLIDDLADNASSTEAARLDLSSVALAITTGVSADPIISDMLGLMRECQIESAIVLELIEGVTSDLETVRMENIDSLLRYCYRVAGTVGLMMCCVLDVDDPAALPHAVDLGIAMQLTNICRDIAEDAAVGRRYLPASMIGNIAPELLISPADGLRPGLRKCVADLLHHADCHYRSGEQGLPYLPVRARSGILVAARVYEAIGKELRRRDCAYWSGRVVLHRGTKTALTARALLSQVLRPSFWVSLRGHNAALHTAIVGLPCTAQVAGGDRAV